MKCQAMRVRGRQGFTLIELMIVIAIIAIIAAVAIPNLLRSRAMANEARALGNLRTIYAESIEGGAPFGFYSSGGYDYNADSQGSWETLLGAAYAGDYDWGVLASPTQPGSTGFRSFWVDNRGVLRVGNGDFGGDPATWASATSNAAD